MSELMSGVFLMVIGMVTVFVFLSLMILMIELIHWIDKTWFPETVAAGGKTGGSRQEIAAITAAVHQHIRGRK